MIKKGVYSRLVIIGVLTGLAAAALPTHLGIESASVYTREIASDQYEIGVLQGQLSSINTQKGTLSTQHGKVLMSALQTQSQINALQGQIDTTQIQFNQVNTQYGVTMSNEMETQAQLDQAQHELGTMISGLYTYSQGNPILTSLVNSGNLVNLFDTEENLQVVNSKMQQISATIAAKKQQLQQLATQEAAQRAQVSTILGELQMNQSQLNSDEASYQQQVALLSSKQSAVTSQGQGIINHINTYRNDEATAEQEQAQLLAQEAAQRAAQAGQTYYGGQNVIGYGANGSFPNHFPWGECTWYVATQRYVPWYGNADQWVYGAEQYGYPVGMTPEVGAIVVFGAGGGYDPNYGHVAYVVSVQGPYSFTVHEGNYEGLGIVDERQVDTLYDVVGFVYG